ncbi:hypothetical protein LLG46_05285 [bacterium]|nr:hypothetical protein [bacterium]
MASLFLLIFPNICCQASYMDFPAEEIYRIRILNQVGGLVQVSLDRGRSYSTVGRVKVAANARITGFSASSYTPHGAVAATAVHGIRIKTGQAAMGVGKAQMPLMFSISPREFSSIPHGYGGHIPRSSAIQLDIHTGQSIFRDFSPYVGNAVFVERDHNLLALPQDYLPITGETFVIVVKRPTRLPREIDFENKIGGDVTAIYPDGTREQITKVDSPVLGIGRYDATTFTGVGAVNTNHVGVLTISTVPVCPWSTQEGGAVETRGGFMVQPYYHAHDQGVNQPQVMIIGTKDSSKPILEGKPPLFFGYINLAWQPGKPNQSYRAQVRIDDGEWEDVPSMVGRIDNAFAAGYMTGYFEKLGKPRKVEKGVTAIRLLFPSFDPDYAAKELNRTAEDYCRTSIKSGIQPAYGIYDIKPQRQVEDSITTYYVDGRTVYTTSDNATAYGWDTTRFANGFHEIVIESASDTGQPVTQRRFVLIMNK